MICYYCGCELTKKTMTQDHLTPVSRGGGGLSKDNIRPSCRECNTEKGNLTEEEYRLFKSMEIDQFAFRLSLPSDFFRVNSKMTLADYLNSSSDTQRKKVTAFKKRLEAAREIHSQAFRVRVRIKHMKKTVI